MLPENEALEKAQKVYDLMAETGLSFTAACAELGFYKMQFHRWREKYPSVEEIITRALDKRQAVWEQKLIKLADTGKGNPAAIIFGLKNTNRSEWNDRIALTDGNGEALKIEQIVRTVIDPATKTIEGEIIRPQLVYDGEEDTNS